MLLGAKPASARFMLTAAHRLQRRLGKRGRRSALASLRPDCDRRQLRKGATMRVLCSLVCISSRTVFLS